MDSNNRGLEQKLLLYSKVYFTEMRMVFPPPKHILMGTELTLKKAIRHRREKYLTNAYCVSIFRTF